MEQDIFVYILRDKRARPVAGYYPRTDRCCKRRRQFLYVASSGWGKGSGGANEINGYHPPITPEAPPTTGGVMAIFVLLPALYELVAANVPPPVNVK
jgi:hypothetical protein